LAPGSGPSLNPIQLAAGFPDRYSPSIESTTMPTSVPNIIASYRAALSFALCNVFALAGALAGRRYYLPHPPSLSESFVITDLRYFGAIIGAVTGGLLAAATARLYARVPLSLSRVTAICSFLFLLWILLETHPIVGLTTVAILLLPWMILIALRMN
jgi:hypothetical protein